VIKDSGAVSMFPQLGPDEWLMQTAGQKNWKSFQLNDFEFLRQKYGVNWVILQSPALGDCSVRFQ